MRHTRKLQIVKLINILTPYLYINHVLTLTTIFTFYQFIVTILHKANYKHVYLNLRYKRKVWTKVIHTKASSFNTINQLNMLSLNLTLNISLTVKQWSIHAVNRTLITRPEFFKLLNIGFNIELWRYYTLYYWRYLSSINTYSLYLVYGLIKSNLSVSRALKNSSTFKTLFVLNLKNL